MRSFPLPALLAAGLFLFPACQTTEEVADETADVATDVADETADIAVDVGDAVADAAGDTWDAVTGLFEDDAETTAAAIVRPTSDAGASAQGTVRFRESGDDLMVDVSLSGLTPGMHGIHIHQNPACSAADKDGDGQMEPAGASGGHWDPLGTNDHGAPTDDSQNKHKGDLGNISVDADGTVETTVTVGGYGPDEYPVAGHAIVIHSGRDDLETDPAGDSGTPQGCGVIEGRM
ncbi:superoxide dismutase family protein [Rubrivirga sp. S365]|uniref:Superoxide dismutase family protein n=1 Tax=Rubrivirga litoralis TaxID=3075598 RepID=A0ABU3BPN7_9BACT|nr:MULTISPECIES: superoxide dismutase family protein [unclassified Rubrivirga]MDT0631233.1 superoxide dismutase family protein [Rubrivirga sp. F394]MDT7856624.1 superoxide dismutase family protein [Rubrivirga sp. S365]